MNRQTMIALLLIVSLASVAYAIYRSTDQKTIITLSCGNITMQNDEKNIRNAFEYARECGIPTIVCSPHPDSMAILDKMVKEFDIRIALQITHLP